jgi:hypothetical protein
MSLAEQVPPSRSPRWDRNRVLFNIDTGGQWVECAISREALQKASDRRHAKPLELLACFSKVRPRLEFSKVRPRLERIALRKYRERSDPMDGPVIIWSGDLDDGLPSAGRSAE